MQVSVAFGQQAKGEVSPGNAVVDRTVIAGHYDVEILNKETGSIERINVNYNLSPVPFINNLNFVLGTAAQVTFSIDITDASGKKVTQWRSSEKSYGHSAQLEITRLQPGNYNFNIYYNSDPALVHSVPFTKSAIK